MDQLLQLLPYPVLVVHAESGRILAANPASAEFYGYSPAGLLGMTLLDLTHQTDLSLSPLERITQNPSRHLHRTRTKLIDVEAIGSFAPFEGQPAISIFVRPLPEPATQLPNGTLTATNLLSAQKHETVSLLLGGVAHDFNNMITGLMGYTELARLSCSPLVPVADYLDQAEKIARRAGELCRQLLAYTGKVKQLVQVIDLAEVVQDTRALLQSLISKRFSLELRLESGWINCDPTEVRQIVMNLVKNAADAQTKGGGSVLVSTGRRYFSTRELSNGVSESELHEGTYCYLEVHDDGVGIPQEDRARIFEPYYTTKPSGSGLGLTSVLSIASSHGGAVIVDSEPKSGTTFTVLLPTAVFPEERGVTDTPAPSMTGRYHLSTS